jgi:hypothetical protein
MLNTDTESIMNVKESMDHSHQLTARRFEALQSLEQFFARPGDALAFLRQFSTNMQAIEAVDLEFPVQRSASVLWMK